MRTIEEIIRDSENADYLPRICPDIEKELYPRMVQSLCDSQVPCKAIYLTEDSKILFVFFDDGRFAVLMASNTDDDGAWIEIAKWMPSIEHLREANVLSPEQEHLQVLWERYTKHQDDIEDGQRIIRRLKSLIVKYPQEASAILNGLEKVNG